MMPSAPALPGVATLWPLCLQIAARRRQGRPPAPLQAGLPIGWSAGQGHSLQGLWDNEALELFELLKPLLDLPRPGAPWAIGQLGQSLDGCIATHGGDSNYVNGPEMLLHLHRLRALCDAVLVGAWRSQKTRSVACSRRPGSSSTRTGCGPGTRRVVSCGSSAAAVPAPTSTASHNARSRCRCSSISGPLT